MTRSTLITLAVVPLVACGASAQNANAPDQKPAFAGQYRAPESKSNVAFDVVTGDGERGTGNGI